MNTRQTYLDSESAAGKELQKWIEQENPGPMREEISLIKYQLAEACRQGQSVLIRDLATCLNQLEKTRTQQRLTLGELWTADQAQAFLLRVEKAISAELQEHFPSDHDVRSGQTTGPCYEDVIGSIRDRFISIIANTKAAAVKTPRLGRSDA